MCVCVRACARARAVSSTARRDGFIVRCRASPCSVPFVRSGKLVFAVGHARVSRACPDDNDYVVSAVRSAPRFVTRVGERERERRERKKRKS